MRDQNSKHVHRVSDELVHQVCQAGDKLQLTRNQIELPFLGFRVHLIKLLFAFDIVSVTEKVVALPEVVAQIVLGVAELLRSNEQSHQHADSGAQLNF